MGGPRRTGWHEAASGPAAVLDESWTWTRDDLVAAAVRPAVADGTAYVAFVTGGPSRARLVVAARSLADGTERWRSSADIPRLSSFPEAATAVTDDSVVATTPSRLVVLDRDTGAERWRTEQAAPTPPVVDDAVLATTGGRDDDGGRRLLDVESGDARWTTPSDDVDVDLGGFASADARSAFLRDGATITAVSLESGTHQWTRHLDPDGYGDQRDVAPVRNGCVEVVRMGLGSEDSPTRGVRLVTLDSGSGQTVRETVVTDARYPWASSAAVGRETVVVAAGRSEAAARADPSTPSGVVAAVERSTGTVRWRTRGDAFHGARLRAGPLVDGEHAYLVGANTLSVLSLDDGTVQWQADVRSNAIFGLGDGAFVWAPDDDVAPGIQHVN